MTDIEQTAVVDADLAKKVRLKLDTAADKRPGRKPATPKPPRPFVGFLVENVDFKPPPRTKQSWLYHLPPMFCTQGDAQVQRDGFQAMAPDDPPKTVFRVTVTFEIVKDGSRG